MDVVERKIACAQMTNEIILSILSKEPIDTRLTSLEDTTSIICKTFEEIYKKIDSLTKED